jgi:DNA-binding NtrC family response regulator
VRQPQNAVRNAVVMHDGERPEAAMLPAMRLRAMPRAAPVVPPAAIPMPPPPQPALAPALAEPEAPALAWVPAPLPEPLPAANEIQPFWLMKKRLIMAALEQTQQHVPRAASLLEIG